MFTEAKNLIIFRKTFIEKTINTQLFIQNCLLVEEARETFSSWTLQLHFCYLSNFYLFWPIIRSKNIMAAKPELTNESSAETTVCANQKRQSLDFISSETANNSGKVNVAFRGRLKSSKLVFLILCCHILPRVKFLDKSILQMSQANVSTFGPELSGSRSATYDKADTTQEVVWEVRKNGVSILTLKNHSLHPEINAFERRGKRNPDHSGWEKLPRLARRDRKKNDHD